MLPRPDKVDLLLGALDALLERPFNELRTLLAPAVQAGQPVGEYLVDLVAESALAEVAPSAAAQLIFDELLQRLEKPQ